jgi:hypothetical protein
LLLLLLLPLLLRKYLQVNLFSSTAKVTWFFMGGHRLWKAFSLVTKEADTEVSSACCWPAAFCCRCVVAAATLCRLALVLTQDCTWSLMASDVRASWPRASMGRYLKTSRTSSTGRRSKWPLGESSTRGRRRKRGTTGTSGPENFRLCMARSGDLSDCGEILGPGIVLEKDFLPCGGGGCTSGGSAARAGGRQQLAGETKLGYFRRVKFKLVGCENEGNVT